MSEFESTLSHLITRISEAYDPRNSRQDLSLQYVTDFVESDDAIQYAERLFDVNSAQTQSIACKILDIGVSKNWDVYSAEFKEGIRNFIFGHIQAYSTPINNQLANILATIATKDFPEKWPDFFENLLSNPAANFGVLANFILLVTDSDSSKITPSKFKVIQTKMIEMKKAIINACIDAVPNNDAKRALDAFLPYIKWEDIDQEKFISLGLNTDTSVFAILSTLLCVEGCPPDKIKLVFTHLCNMVESLDSEEVFNSICSVLIKHAKILEEEQLPLVRGMLNKIAECDFDTHLDFWETFILGVFDTHKTDPTHDRFIMYQDIFENLRDYVLKNMPQPPGFILPGEGDTSLDESAMETYTQMRNIFVAILTMAPEKVMPAITKIFTELNSVFSPKVFCSLIWSISCITGSTGSVVEGQFVVESLTFILKSLKNPKLTKEVQSVVASAFLYLVAAYAKVQKLTAQFVTIALNLAISGLLSENLRKMAANAILAIGTNCPTLVTNLPDMTDLIMNNVLLAPDIYADVCEGFGKIYHAKQKLSKLVDMALERWNNTKNYENNMDVVTHTHLVLAILLGFARADPVFISKVVSKLIEDLIHLITDFGTHIVEFTDFAGNEEVKEMYMFCRTAAILFKTCGIKQCKPLLEIYKNSSPNIRQIEVLQLAESLLKSELKDEEAQVIHELVIDPTKEMIAQDETFEPIFVSLIPGVINNYLQSYFKTSVVGDPCNLETDLQFLYTIARGQNHTAIVSAISAIENALTKADMNLTGDARKGFFRGYLLQTIATMMFIATEPSHKFCLEQIFKYIIKLFKFIVCERVQVDLFDGIDNIQGTINELSAGLCEEIPIISLQNMKYCIQMLLEANKYEDYEQVLVEFISEARMTVPSETLKHIMLKKVKSCIEEEV
ncbi:hypothetical protein TVAG_490230 [Trichomonas vaginalis G3]|uniref:Importin N-terminal domain-containing protein n=1 Tax=Trichomonas vaginalis (strain ATCC PRA-98 / G3) TaxID=412133 RepID=A2F0W0_TRIV3|nr:nuclear export signal receptor protein [Trichomonas vaginalis G3]EAY01435.1 hypothetical protein TVAG_490230 [Trichomonas vaginalis G3]KAI5519278.1 nuclear export signal receptor protein [Trichomonas vaginalis G3]|eukprot:XP_001314139.1 hypothetical protein [Trichomonas vaginalis G3]